jgi:spore maturation protein CgeB
MTRPLSIVFVGLSLSSSWGNGHATTYRALLKGLSALGHHVTFLERTTPWYTANRDLAEPDFCQLTFYDDLADLKRFADLIATADIVCLGSYVPDGAAVADWLKRTVGGTFCFYDIDTPVTISMLENGEHTYLRPDQVPGFDVYFSFAGGRSVEALRERFCAHEVFVLYCSVDEGVYRNTGDARRWDLGYLGTYSDDRQPTLERLLIEPARRLPHLRFVVAGSQYPDTIDWPANVERIDHLPPADHPAFYSSQRYTLNVTRADMIRSGWSPSVRLFEAAACHTPIISDFWDGLEDIFPDAVAIAETSDDIAALLDGRPDFEATALADRARQIVLRDHTGKARAREFVAAACRNMTANGLASTDGDESDAAQL